MIRRAAAAILCVLALWVVWQVGWAAGSALANVLLGPPRLLGMPV